MQKHARTVKAVSLAVIVVSVLLLMRALPVGQYREALEMWIEGLGVIGPAVFALVYAVATLLLLPVFVLTLAAGAIFGLWTGLITVTVGANVGAGAAFLIARYAARAKVEEMAAARPKFKAIDEAIAEGGWKIVALLRLSPAIPFNVQNYLYGLTNIRFWTCVLTSFVAMIPGTFMYIYVGHIFGAAADGDRQRTPGEWALLIVGLLAAVVVVVYIAKLARKKLDERTAGAEAMTGPELRPAETPSSVAGALGYALAAVCLLALAIAAQLKLRDP